MSATRIATTPLRAAAIFWLGCFAALWLTAAVATSSVMVSFCAAAALGLIEPSPIELTAHGMFYVRAELLVPFTYAVPHWKYRFGLLSHTLPVTPSVVADGLLRPVIVSLAACATLSTAWVLAQGVESPWQFELTDAELSLAKSVLAQFAAWVLVHLGVQHLTVYEPSAPERGNSVLPLATLRRHADEPGRGALLWAGLFTRQLTHAVALMRSGTGKTLLTRMFLRSALAPRGKLVAKAIILDAKRTFVPEVAGLLNGSLEQVSIMLGIDSRSLPWAIARDYYLPVHSVTLAAVLVPENRGDPQPFWNRGSQAVVAAAIRALQQLAPRRWTLHQLLHLCETRSRLLHLLSQVPAELDSVRDYLSEPRQAASLMATLNSHLHAFRPLAATWERNTNASISLREWSQRDRGVLLIGSDVVFDAALAGLNRLMLSCLAECALSLPESTKRTPTYWLLDELPVLGRGLDFVPKLCREGRTRRQVVVATSQDYESLVASFGEQDAASLVAQSDALAFASPMSIGTERMLGSLAGHNIVTRRGYSESEGSTSVSTHSQTAPLVLSSEFDAMGGPSRKDGLPIIGRVHHAWFRGLIKPRFIRRHLPAVSKRSEHAPYLRHRPEMFAPLGMSQNAYERLGLSWPPPSEVNGGETEESFNEPTPLFDLN